MGDSRKPGHDDPYGQLRRRYRNTITRSQIQLALLAVIERLEWDEVLPREGGVVTKPEPKALHVRINGLLRGKAWVLWLLVWLLNIRD